ncbi:hypothetical protein Hden_1163 [Hyphomicrobium denitrificans ATCC 51888]|uniref:Uncharacterized protein n=1 Tax=Hyphomicrobium denitrificans (strain ATCC 51888 / DSM 1869 / NCIMB 11706 / TK 0415) TaxID=582899 RepID=D8JVT8_HYPDA|nr:hypothetical protein [Hyphomicrobium denitrificans]ADJ22977.1 hypothetical protein Hden_1163 [Hyphomicrobium denitrificans ATCC 51888]
MSEAEAMDRTAAIRDALKPFADAAEMFAWPVFERDDYNLVPGTKLTVGDLRKARAAYAEIERLDRAASTTKEG